jgi:hypothetical protein
VACATGAASAGMSFHCWLMPPALSYWETREPWAMFHSHTSSALPEFRLTKRSQVPSSMICHCWLLPVLLAHCTMSAPLAVDLA